MKPEAIDARELVDPETERTILGAIILRPELLAEVSRYLSVENFSLTSHRNVFLAMLDTKQADVPLSETSLMEFLERRGELHSLGGEEYVMSLIDGVAYRTDVKRLCARLVDISWRRQVYHAADQLQLETRAAGSSAALVISRLRELWSLASEADETSRGDLVAAPFFSQEDLALRFSAMHESTLRYVSALRKWYVWNRNRWLPDQTLKVTDMVRRLCREYSMACPDRRTAIRLASVQTIEAVERLARSDHRLASSPEQWDCNPWLFNTPDGTVDLRTGITKAHRSDQLLTKMAAVGPAGDCPMWKAFLDRITNRNLEVQEFLRRVVGYCLTGVATEHAVFFLSGTGANGKSVFIATISGLLGDYARTAPLDMFMVSSNERHPTDLASLRGARLVATAETDHGHWWAESKLKAVTGGDRIAARYMRQDYFEYLPQFKLLIAGNHRPRIRNIDEAMRRRIHLIPFTVTIPESERDQHLVEKLKSEWPGIAQWAVDGCLEWQQRTLTPPGDIRRTTQEYFMNEDVLGRWLDERTMKNFEHFTSTAALFGDFREWAHLNGEPMGTLREFAEKLEEQGGIRKKRNNVARGYLGVVLKKAIAS